MTPRKSIDSSTQSSQICSSIQNDPPKKWSPLRHSLRQCAKPSAVRCRHCLRSFDFQPDNTFWRLQNKIHIPLSAIPPMGNPSRGGIHSTPSLQSLKHHLLQPKTLVRALGYIIRTANPRQPGSQPRVLPHQFFRFAHSTRSICMKCLQAGNQAPHLKPLHMSMACRLRNSRIPRQIGFIEQPRRSPRCQAHERLKIPKVAHIA